MIHHRFTGMVFISMVGFSFCVISGCQMAKDRIEPQPYKEPDNCVKILGDGDNGARVELKVGQSVVIRSSSQAVPDGCWYVKAYDERLLSVETKPPFTPVPPIPAGSVVTEIYEITALQPGWTMFEMTTKPNERGTYQVEFVITE